MQRNTRRSFIRGGVAALATTSVGPFLIHPAIGMEPLTVAAAIAGIVSAIKGLIDSTSTQQWENSVSGKLDIIIDQNAAILQQLKELPVLFAQDLQAAFNAEAVIQGKSLADSFDQYMSGKVPDIDQIKGIRTQAEVLANNIVQRGPCVYQGASAITALVLAVHKILHVDHGETQALVNHILGAMTTWAGNSDGMFGKAIQDTTSLLQGARTTLANEPRGEVTLFSQQVEVVLSGPHGGIHVHPTLKVLANVVIDDNALTFSVNNAHSTWFDTARFNDDVVAQYANAWSAKLNAETGAIKQNKVRLDSLQSHELALQQIIASLQSWQS